MLVPFEDDKHKHPNTLYDECYHRGEAHTLSLTCMCIGEGLIVGTGTKHVGLLNRIHL